MTKALRFLHSAVPRQPGELARLKVVQGPDFGAIYVLLSPKSRVGRGEENSVVLADLRASRVHAEILQKSPNSWRLQDLGSANGIGLASGEAVRELELKSGMKFTLGETTLEFYPADDSGTKTLMAPVRSWGAQNPHGVALGTPSGAPMKATLQGPGLSDFLANKTVIGILGVFAVFAIFLWENPPDMKRKLASQIDTDLSTFLPPADRPTEQVIERFLKTGLREYREKNFLRAKAQFDTVLQIAPGHPFATRYSLRSQQQIDDEVKRHLDLGRRGIETNRLKTARGHYESVKRLLHRSPSSEAYTEAEKQLETVKKIESGELGGGS